MNRLAIAKQLCELATVLVETKRRAMQRDMRRAVSADVWLKQVEKTERKLGELLAPVFRAQVEQAAGQVGKQITLDKRQWTAEIIDAALPVLAVGMFEAATANLLTVGIEPRKGTKRRQPITARPSTASEWLAEQEEPLPDLFAAGDTTIAISTEYPEWMKDAIEIELREQFAQPYWSDMTQTTIDDLEQTVRLGAQEGLSIREMAARIKEIHGDEYYRRRSQAIARTEVGGSLNSARTLAVDHLKDSLPPDLAKHVGREWHSVLANSTRAEHAEADGQLEDENGMFTVGGELTPWPKHWSMSGWNRINCFCSTVTSFGVGAEEEIQEYIEEAGFAEYQRKYLAGQHDQSEHK